jgi:hypothetical protein
MTETTMTDMRSRVDTRWAPDVRSPLVIALVALFVLQLLIGLGLSMTGGRTMAPQSGEEALFAFTPEQVQRIRLANGDASETLVLSRQGDGWVIADLGDAPVNADQVERVLTDLAALKRPLPVGSSAEARKRFKVADDQFERRVVVEGDDGPVAQLIVGDSPGFRRVFARIDGEPDVYDLRLALTDVSPNRDDWVKTDLLRIEPDQIVRVSRGDWVLSKAEDGTWAVEGDTRTLDQEAVKALIQRLENLSYRGILGAQDDPAYRQETPEVVLDIGLTDGTTRQYRVSQADGSEDRVLKDTARPWYFKVTDLDLGELLDLETDAFIANPEPLEPPGIGDGPATGALDISSDPAPQEASEAPSAPLGEGQQLVTDPSAIDISESLIEESVAPATDLQDPEGAVNPAIPEPTVEGEQPSTDAADPATP